MVPLGFTGVARIAGPAGATRSSELAIGWFPGSLGGVKVKVTEPGEVSKALVMVGWLGKSFNCSMV